MAMPNSTTHLLLSPTTFLVLIILVEFCIEHRSNAWTNPSAKAETLRFLLKTIQNPPPHKLHVSVSELLSQLDQIVAIREGVHDSDVSLARILVFQMDKIAVISNLDAVFDLAEAIVGGVKGGDARGFDLESVLVLKPTSELGIFVRRLVLEYKSCSFSGVTRFFERVCEARKSVHLWQQRNEPGYANNSEKSVGSDAVVVAKIDADRYLDVQGLLKDLYVGSFADESLVKKDLEEIASEFPDEVKLYYVEHLVAIKQRDLSTAVEKIRQFFDYTPVHMKKNMRHYAPLHLAHIYLHFGQPTLAHAMLRESKSAARFANDSECLNYCLDLECKLQQAGNRAVNSVVEDQQDAGTLLDTLAQRSKELGMSRVREDAELMRVDWLVGRGSERGEVVAGLKRVRVEDRVGQDESVGGSGGGGLVVAAGVASARVWETYGQSKVSELHLESHDAMVPEIRDGESLEHVVHGLVIQAEKKALNGLNEESEHFLERAQDLMEGGLSVEGNLWVPYVRAKMQVRDGLNRCLSNGDIQTRLETLREVAKCGGSIDWDLETRHLEAQMLKRMGRMDEAFQHTTVLIRDAKLAKRDALIIPFVLLLADIHLSQSNPHAALPHILTAITLSKAYSQDMQTRNAHVALSRFYLQSQMTQKAVKTVEAVVGVVRVHGNAMERGNVEQVYAECLVAEFEQGRKQMGDDWQERIERIRKHFDAAYS
ncbi:hypothetical protein HDU98_010313, partial [Podochytrium sp. JEL0797]